MKEKQLYTAPEADLLVVRFEENIMSGGNLNAVNVNNLLEYLDSDDDYEEL